MPKLTLSVDAEVVALAKRYAKAHGVSVSGLVQAYLSAVARPGASERDSPMLRTLRGTLKKARPEDYKKHLSRKYR
jgi:hypothetical protein